MPKTWCRRRDWTMVSVATRCLCFLKLLDQQGVPIRKKGGNSQKHAFEILASVAGELLQESKIFVPPNCKEDQQNTPKNIVLKERDEGQLSKCNHSVQETHDEKTFIQGYHQIYTLNKFSHSQDRFNLKACSSIKSFDQSEKLCLADQLANVNDRNGSPSAKIGISSLVSGEFSEGQFEDAGAELSSIQSVKSATLPVTGSFDMLEMDCKPHALFCSESKLKASLFEDWITLGPSRHADNIETVTRDDDDNDTGCTQAATTAKAFRLPSDVADQRIKNLSAGRHWRVSPNLNGGASFKNDGKRRSFFHNGRTSYTRQRSQRISPFNRRKLFNQFPFSVPDRGFQFEDKFNSADKRSNCDNCTAAVGVASSVARRHLLTGPRGRNVKLRIKSFKVPELFVEIPTSATVGSLKRTVMEALTTVLGDGLHVGIFLQGKKVRDDSKTLFQTGISQDHKHRNLGFALESRHAQIIPPPCPGEQGLTRHATSLTPEPGTSSVSLVPPLTNWNSGAESDLHLVSSLSNISADSTIPNSQSLVSIPAIRVETLAVVPFHHRPGCHEFVQRRIRRLFSVAEVEALVQAVEKLGTGRWRDVKLGAFDNAKHRTYVDLKDKWKTLVHTARISPQRRRGEPVPQELLDRVLAAHAYWSGHQAKRQLK
ncbi:telomere repeat-binding protein 5-like isoform X3 [Herrania umbratica]|uniref:Telomere repeat-binding protein 5-like isoform X3 n=1 Tax=Herrania umbratica TaxID=108875 RepID=A0A6J1AU50_9ROSI|nr:telomere repeat-binding protein 5-like isoform X3 [Herrania umbratica]